MPGEAVARVDAGSLQTVITLLSKLIIGSVGSHTGLDFEDVVVELVLVQLVIQLVKIWGNLVGFLGMEVSVSHLGCRNVICAEQKVAIKVDVNSVVVS